MWGAPGLWGYATQTERGVDHFLHVDYIHDSVIVQIVCGRHYAKSLADDRRDIRGGGGSIRINVAGACRRDRQGAQQLLAAIRVCGIHSLQIDYLRSDKRPVSYTHLRA